MKAQVVGIPEVREMERFVQDFTVAMLHLLLLRARGHAELTGPLYTLFQLGGISRLVDQITATQDGQARLAKARQMYIIRGPSRMARTIRIMGWSDAERGEIDGLTKAIEGIARRMLRSGVCVLRGGDSLLTADEENLVGRSVGDVLMKFFHFDEAGLSTAHVEVNNRTAMPSLILEPGDVFNFLGVNKR